MVTEQEAFWNLDDYVVITDNTKPAMKLTVDELRKRGKTVHTIDLTEITNPESIRAVSDIPDNVHAAVIGITKAEPADYMKVLEEKGIKKMWIHWRTETPVAKALCDNPDIQCITGRCPMMYMGNGMSIHGIHRAIAKLTGKY